MTTIKIDKGGKKVVEKVENLLSKPNEFKDLANSMKMLEKIKRDSSTAALEKGQIVSAQHSRMVNLDATQNSLASGLSKASGAGLLSQILNPKRVASVHTLKHGNSSNVYVQTVDALAGRDGSPNRKASKKRITIIKRKRRPDGSVDCSK